MLRRIALVLTVVVLAAAMAFPPARSVVLLRTEAGPAIPLLVFGALTALPLVAILSSRFLAPRLQPWALRVHTLLPEALAWYGLQAIVLLEGAMDAFLTHAIGWDFTGLVHAIEGDTGARLQEALRSTAARPALDLLFTLLYSYGFVALYGGTIAWAFLCADHMLVRRLLRTYLLIWSVGIPTWILLPVSEPWFHSDAVLNVLHETIPASKGHSMAAINLNNELPSLHVALSFGTAVTTLGMRRRAAMGLLFAGAAGIAFSTLYLGIHWILDVVAGIVLGVGAGILNVRYSNLGWPRTPRAPDVPAPRDADMPGDVRDPDRAI